MQGAGFRVQDAGCRVQGAGCGTLKMWGSWGIKGLTCNSFYGLSVVWRLKFYSFDFNVVVFWFSVFLEQSPFLSHK